jgi:hypothetical protein
MSKMSLREILNFPCKIAYLGNSITAQKNSFHEYLHVLLNAQYKNISNPIKAGIGGVGSLACNFMANQLVLDRNPQICFVECLAADMGGATPLELIDGAVEGLVQKLLSKDIFVIFLYLFRSSATYDVQSILPIYEDIASRYRIPTINVFDYIKNQYIGRYDEILSDGIHTTPFGAAVYAQYIASSLSSFLDNSTPQPIPEPKNFRSFINTNIFLPTQFDPGNLDVDRRKLFRLYFPYVEIRAGEKVLYESNSHHVIGFMFLADIQCGVISITNDDSNDPLIMQLADQWCKTPRIQAAYFKKPISPNKRVTLAILSDDRAPYGANGQVNTFVQTGDALKIFGFLEYKPDIL